MNFSKRTLTILRYKPVLNILSSNTRIYSNVTTPVLLNQFFPKNNNSRYTSTKSTPTITDKETHQPEYDTKVVKIQTLTNAEKLKKAVKDYGATVIIFHIGISLISLGTCYVLITGGIDANKVFETLGLKEWACNSKLAANAGTFAVAYAVHKVFAPVRISITLASVPFIVKYLRKRGILKK